MQCSQSANSKMCLAPHQIMWALPPEKSPESGLDYLGFDSDITDSYTFAPARVSAVVQRHLVECTAKYAPRSQLNSFASHILAQNT